MATRAAEPHPGDPSIDEKQVALDHQNLGFENGVQDLDISPEEDRRILRKLDMCLLPLMAISYFFQFLDKGALSSAAILSLLPDLKLTGNDYSWAGSIYYFGYLAASYPAAWVMVRWRVGKLISSSIIAWGAVLMFTALCVNSSGLLAVRFFLGVTEAAIAPGLMIMISMWYKRGEQPLRQCAWFLGNTAAAIFGSLISYGVGHINSIAPWKAVFLIFGAITIVWGAVVMFVLPDTPANARFLNKEDRQKAVIRVKDNLTGLKSNKLRWNQVFEALTDYRSWVLFFLQISASIPNGGLSSFGAIVIRNFKFTVFQTLLLGALLGLIQLMLVLISAVGAAYFKNSRTLWMSWNLALSIMGSVLVRQLPAQNKWGRFMGVATSTAYAVNFPLQLSLLTGNVGGFTKKATVSAMMFVAYCGGNVIGPQLFFADEAGKNYPSAFLAIIICLSFCLILVVVFRYCLIMENKRRDRVSESGDKATVVGGVHGEFLVNLLDKTDRELPQFRYIY